ncbi:hypothetical protein MtrunA17_Chr5g0425461 [Medicago truncatula]|uniref:Uncharacterized protein n=1 Tax=Medicago truncatula TaxID=3880 RepID=A0A396HRV2_MEDTR|nr:hypothetical protein MtrunA17_Chr5g0425461 [Medicago truncatula]
MLTNTNFKSNFTLSTSFHRHTLKPYQLFYWISISTFLWLHKQQHRMLPSHASSICNSQCDRN